jgi:hypothetical protein
MVKLCAAMVGAVTVALLSACSGSAGPIVRPGIITGIAGRCVGGAPRAGLPRVRVSANRSGQTVATDVVNPFKDHDMYRLSVPPGRYVVTARGSMDPPQVVNLRLGERVVINFDRCLVP